MQVAPSKELSAYIKHYLFLESEWSCVKKLRLFSDGNTGMVLTFRGNLLADMSPAKKISYPNSFLYGQISAFKDLYLAEKTSVVIVVFQPHGLHHLMGISANACHNAIISAEEIFGHQAILLHDKLSVLSEPMPKLNILNSFFLELCAKKTLSNHSIIPASLSHILKNKGNISINHLVKLTGYTERHIERTFKESIGLTPKKFGNIVRLHYFLSLIKEKARRSQFTDLCYEAGYSDQSHLIREFKKYTGITPTTYLHDTNKLAKNFVEIKSEQPRMSVLYNL